MARVRNPKPSPSPMYPTSGKIHILFIFDAMSSACFVGRDMYLEKVSTKGVQQACSVSTPDFAADHGRKRWPTKNVRRKGGFATAIY